MKQFAVFLCLFVHWTIFSQNLNITEQYNFGGSSNDNMFFTEIPNSSGKFLIGNSSSNISGNKTENSRGDEDIWIVKLDNNMNVEWDKTIGGSHQDLSFGGILEDDKLFISAITLSPISGDKTTAGFGGYDIWMLCLDTLGNLLWQAEYGGDNNENCQSIISYSDTSLLIAATSYSGVSGNKTLPSFGQGDYWILEISKSNGSIIQQKVFGSDGEDRDPYIAYCSVNNNYYILGISNGGANGSKTDPGFGISDLWVLQLDENLNLIQDKCFGGDFYEDSHGKLLCDNDLLYFSAASNSPISGNKSESPFNTNIFPPVSDLWQIKTDLDLNIIWNKVYGGTGDELGYNIFKNSNGNFVVSCYSKSIESGNKTSPRYGVSFDIWMFIMDENGAMLAQESYGGTSDEYGFIYPKNSSNTELYLNAYSLSGIDGNKTVPSWGDGDFWLATIDASDFLSTASLNSSNQSVAVYPNPFTSEANFKFRNLSEAVIISFYTVDGRLIDEVRVHPSLDTVYSWKNSGSESLILYSIQGETVHFNGKLVR